MGKDDVHCRLPSARPPAQGPIPSVQLLQPAVNVSPPGPPDSQGALPPPQSSPHSTTPQQLSEVDEMQRLRAELEMERSLRQRAEAMLTVNSAKEQPAIVQGLSAHNPEAMENKFPQLHQPNIGMPSVEPPMPEVRAFTGCRMKQESSEEAPVGPTSAADSNY